MRAALCLALALAAAPALAKADEGVSGGIRLLYGALTEEALPEGALPEGPARAPALLPEGEALGVGTPEPGDGPPPLPVLAYHVELDGTAQGPFDRDRLLSLMREDRLGPDTLVWTKGMDGWAEAAGRADLSKLLAAAAGAAVPGTAAPVAVATTAPVAATPSAAPEAPPDAWLAGRWRVTGRQPIEGLGEAQVSLTETYGPGNAYAASGTYTLPLPESLGIDAPLVVNVEITGTFSANPGLEGEAFGVFRRIEARMTDRLGLGMEESVEGLEAFRIVREGEDAWRAESYAEGGADLRARRMP